MILRQATLIKIAVNLENLQVHLKSSFGILLFAILHFRPMKNLSKIEFEIYAENINQIVLKISFQIFGLDSTKIYGSVDSWRLGHYP